MPIDPNIAMAYRGVEVPNQLAQYAQLAQIQGAQQSQAANAQQLEIGRMQLEELKNDRMEMEKFSQELAAKGGNPDLNTYADMLLKSPKNFKLGIELKQKLKDQFLYDQYIKSQGGGGSAPVGEPAPVGGSAPVGKPAPMGGPAPVSMGAAPINAMAPRPAPSVNAMAPQPTPSINAMGQEQQILNNIRMLSASGDPRAKAEVDVLKAQLAEVRKVPTEVREFQYAQNNPAFEQYQMRLKRAGSTNVNLPAQEKAFESELGGGQAKAILKSREGAQDAASILQTNEVGRQILNSGALTGAGAEFFVGLNQALKTAGVDSGYADAAANSQAYAATMAANTGKLIKQFGAGTGLSDSDKAYATKAAAGEIAMDEKAIRKVLTINDKAARNVIALHNKSVEGVKTNIPLKVEMPPEVKTPAAANLVTNPAFPGFSIGKP